MIRNILSHAGYPEDGGSNPALIQKREFTTSQGDVKVRTVVDPVGVNKVEGKLSKRQFVFFVGVLCSLSVVSISLSDYQAHSLGQVVNEHSLQFELIHL